MDKQLYRELRIKIIGLTLMVAIAPLVLLGGAIYYQFARAHESRIVDQMTQLAGSQSNAVEVFLRERTTILAMLVETNTYEQLAKPSTLARVFEAMNRRTDMLGFIDLGVIDDRGEHMAYVGPFQLQGLNYYKEPWFAEVMTKGKYISDVYMGFRRIPHFIIAVRGYNGDHQWILRATIDSDVFNRLVRTVQFGRLGDAFIINEESIYQTSPRFQGEILGRSDLLTRHFSQGGIMVEKRTNQGQTEYFAGSWLKIKKWLLVIRQQTGDENDGLLYTRNMEIIIICLGISAIVLTTIFITNLVVGRLEAASKEMDALNAQLIQSDKLAALGKMAAGIAHEINNPLAVIGEKAGWMKDLLSEEEFQQSPNLKEYASSVNKIEEHVERARKITHNMLGFARRMEPRLDDVEVNRVLDQTIDLLSNHARINDIEIHRRYHPELPIIASDQSQLQQVFLNLINNAIDAIGSNGNIEIITELANDCILIHIKDNGPGIPKEQQRRIFDPFFSTKTKSGGTGLGLSISYSIVEKMKGTLTCHSEVGRGTTFSVQLPIVVPPKK